MDGILGNVVPICKDVWAFLPAVEDDLQLLAHLDRTGIAVPGVVRAGFQHDFSEPPSGVAGRRQGRAGKTLLYGVVPVLGLDRRGRGGEKWEPVAVQQPVKHQPKGINVHRGVVRLPFIDLRGHIGFGPCFGHAAGFVRCPGDAEIPQLKVPHFGDENILRLDVPVDDVELLAQFQGIAKVDAQLDDVPLGNGVADDVFVQRGQKLHLD